MKVTKYDLGTLIAEQKALDKTAFAERYDGAFLVAMGYISVEKMRAAADINATCRAVFGPNLRHDASNRHPLEGKVFMLHSDLEKDEVFLGRGLDCTIVIPDSSVSEKHCRLACTEEAVTAIDLDSTNGTRINLEALSWVEPRKLEAEDILTLGRYSFQFHSPSTLCDSLFLMSALA